MPSRSRSRNQAPKGPARVTVVNDDPDAGEIVARVLEAEGHQVVRAFDRADALQAITSDLPDVAVLDMGGGANNPGLQLLERLRHHANPSVRDVRVVLMCTKSGAEVFAWDAGVDGYLDRPVRADDLARVVAEALARPEKERAGYRASAHQSALGRS